MNNINDMNNESDNDNQYWTCAVCTFEQNSIHVPLCKICQSLPPVVNADGNIDSERETTEMDGDTNTVYGTMSGIQLYAMTNTQQSCEENDGGITHAIEKELK